MPRDARAYLGDVIESCNVIADALQGVDLDTYKSNRILRSAVEREFIIIGEAMAALSRIAPNVFASVTTARRIVDFRNQLTHEYSSINDTIVWGLAAREMTVLRDQCSLLLESLEPGAGH